MVNDILRESVFNADVLEIIIGIEILGKDSVAIKDRY
jgi:hypothetical protein